MKAFERADVEGLKRLLTDDVLMEMPPMINWFTGPVAANGQPGFAAYRRAGDACELHTLQVFTVTAGGISRNSVFQEADVLASFGLPARLDAEGLPQQITSL